MTPRRLSLDTLLFGIRFGQEVLQPRLRFPHVRYQGHGPKDGSRVETPAHLLSAFLEPMRCLRKKFEWNRIPSKRIVKYLKFWRPWLIPLGPESTILVGRYIQPADAGYSAGPQEPPARRRPRD
jgi:hypothetical protein